MGSEVTTTPQVSAQSFSELEVPFDEFVQPLGLIGRSQWVPMSRQHFSQSKKSGWSFWPTKWDSSTATCLKRNGKIWVRQRIGGKQTQRSNVCLSHLDIFCKTYRLYDGNSLFDDR